ncbi:MAG: cell division transport system permease protein [Lysobacterales bacterium]|jgi:cell division transport system permease protein
MFQHRIGTLMTILVLGIAILLPLGLFVTLNNLDRLDLQQEQWGAITVFLAEETDQVSITSLSQSLESRPDVNSVEVVSPEQGMAEFRDSSGFGQSLEMLEDNPLPWVLMVTPVIVASSDPDVELRLQELMAHLESREGVQSVQFDYKWLQRLGRMLELGRAAVLVLTFLFSVAVIVVVANTIRLDVAARSEEIEILALVGAVNSFIRQPFLYSGFWYGLMGGALAAGLMQLCLFYLDAPLSSLLDAYGQGISLYGLSLKDVVALMLASGLLGLLGAWVSVQRYLKMLHVGGSLGRR